VPKPTFDNHFLETLKKRAKKLAREDKSANHTKCQWLDKLCAEYGYTYTSLKRHVEALEQAAWDAEEDALWAPRFSAPFTWGVLTEKSGTPPRQNRPLPFMGAGEIPWPRCFALSPLFSIAECPRRMLSDELSVLDGTTIFFKGEELRQGQDVDVLMGLFMVSGRSRCGSRVETSLANLEAAWGRSLQNMGLSAERRHLEKSLWRLAHCTLTVQKYDYDGPLLAYADASNLPDRLAFRLHPDLANLFYPSVAAALIG
jgi:hypothetical protein